MLVHNGLRDSHRDVILLSHKSQNMTVMRLVVCLVFREDEGIKDCLLHISELACLLKEVYLCWCSEAADAGDANGFEDVQKKGRKKKKNKKKAAEEPESDSTTPSSTSKWWTFEKGNGALKRRSWRPGRKE